VQDALHPLQHLVHVLATYAEMQPLRIIEGAAAEGALAGVHCRRLLRRVVRAAHSVSPRAEPDLSNARMNAACARMPVMFARRSARMSICIRPSKAKLTKLLQWDRMRQADGS
jgi:hypothetical protein